MRKMAELYDGWAGIIESTADAQAAHIATLQRERDGLRARLSELCAFSGMLATHVRGHFALPTENSRAICEKLAVNVQQMNELLHANTLTGATHD